MLKRREIGVDLGSDSIKIALVDETSTDTSIYDSQNPNLRYLSEGEIYEVNCTPHTEEYYKLLRDSLKDFAKKNKFMMMSLNISIPVDNVSDSNILFINMPRVDGKDLEKGISFEAEQELLESNINESSYTWKISEEYPEINEYEVMLATIRNNILRSLSKFKTITWKINRLMLQPIMLERVVAKDDVIIDFGHSSTRVYLYERGKLKQTEFIKVGGKKLADKIDKYLEDSNLEGDSYEILKSTFVVNELLSSLEGLGWGSDDDVSEDIDNSRLPRLQDEIETDDELEDDEEDIPEIAYDYEEISDYISDEVYYLIDEIKRVVRAFELQNALEVEKIYYVGELSNFRYLKESIEADLDVDLNPINVVAHRKDSLLFSIAGIASMDPKLEDNTNFSKLLRSNIDYPSIAVAAVAITLSVGIALKMADVSYENRLDDLTATQSEQNETIMNLDEESMALHEQVREDEEFLDVLDSLKSQKKWLSDILYMIPERTPITVSIIDMEIKNEEVVIKGLSSDYSSVGFFARELEDVGETTIDSIENYNNEDGAVYSVTMDDPELISDKYLITKSFTMTLTHNEGLIEH